MFELPVLLLVSGVFTAIQIGVWQMFPEKLRDVLFANPVLAFIVNLLGSGMITAFTGVASFVGICNMMASILFGIYAWVYGKNKGIKKLGLGWFKLFKFIPIFPKVMVCYEKNGRVWAI